MKKLLKSEICGSINSTQCAVCGRKVNICGYCSLNSIWTVTAFCQNAWKKKKKKKAKRRRVKRSIQTNAKSQEKKKKGPKTNKFFKNSLKKKAKPNLREQNVLLPNSLSKHKDLKDLKIQPYHRITHDLPPDVSVSLNYCRHLISLKQSQFSFDLVF